MCVRCLRRPVVRMSVRPSAVRTPQSGDRCTEPGLQPPVSCLQPPLLPSTLDPRLSSHHGPWSVVRGLMSTTLLNKRNRLDAAPASPPTLCKTRLDMIEVSARVCQFLGIRRSTGQIYGLLYLSPEPLTLDEIAESLGISRGSVSTGTRLLLASDY